MQKLFKRFALLLTAMIAILCMTAFGVACTDGGDKPGIENPNGDNNNYATTTFTVIVKDENGNIVDPSIGMYYGEPTSVAVRFCSVMPNGELGACANPVAINSEGKAVFDLAALKGELSASIAEGSTKMGLHIYAVEELGYEEDYAEYEYDKIPLEIVVQLVKTAA